MTELNDVGYNLSDHFSVHRFNSTQMTVSVWNSYNQTYPDLPFALIVVC